MFTEKTLIEAWERSAGRCECERRTHQHFYTPCGKSLIWRARGTSSQGGWEAYHVIPSGGDGLQNCEILCWECYKSVSGYAVPGMYSELYLGPTKQIQIGDYIRLESGEEGSVSEIRYDSVRIRALDGSDFILPNSGLRHIVDNYGHLTKKAKTPFRFYNLDFLKELTGLKARNLVELTGILKVVTESSVYYHTYLFLQECQYLKSEPANDFAVWVADSLGDEFLGEKLASVDPFSFSDLNSVREEFIKIVEDHLSRYPNNWEAMEGKEFNFIKSARIIFPTPYIAHDLREFCGALRRVSPGSLYFHIFESRLSSANGLNDFSNWLMDSLEEEDLSRMFALLDPYTYTLEGLRQSLVKLIEKRIIERR